ncbi:unnamed protein product [Rhodiola kirilowii]
MASKRILKELRTYREIRQLRAVQDMWLRTCSIGKQPSSVQMAVLTLVVFSSQLSIFLQITLSNL